jgi:hypothetical protein
VTVTVPVTLDRPSREPTRNRLEFKFRVHLNSAAPSQCLSLGDSETVTGRAQPGRHELQVEPALNCLWARAPGVPTCQVESMWKVALYDIIHDITSL